MIENGLPTITNFPSSIKLFKRLNRVIILLRVITSLLPPRFDSVFISLRFAALTVSSYHLLCASLNDEERCRISATRFDRFVVFAPQTCASLWQRCRFSAHRFDSVVVSCALRFNSVVVSLRFAALVVLSYLRRSSAPRFVSVVVYPSRLDTVVVRFALITLLSYLCALFS